MRLTQVKFKRLTQLALSLLMVISLLGFQEMSVSAADDELLKNTDFTVTFSAGHYAPEPWTVGYPSTNLRDTWYTDNMPEDQWQEQYKPIPGGAAIRAFMELGYRKVGYRGNRLTQTVEGLVPNRVYKIDSTVTMTKNNATGIFTAKVEVVDSGGTVVIGDNTITAAAGEGSTAEGRTSSKSIYFKPSGTKVTVNLKNESYDTLETIAEFTGISLKAVTSGGVTVNHVDTDGNPIADSTTITGFAGDAYTSSPVTNKHYTLKTTPANASGKLPIDHEEITYVYEAADGENVTVKYVNLKGEPISGEDTLKGKINSDYEAVAKTITNYHLVETQGSAKGKFTDTAQTVTFVYDLNRGADVIAKYVDIDGNKIAEDETYSGDVTAHYFTTDKTIENYELTVQPDNATGTFTDQVQTVTYIYDLIPGGDVTVKYVDTDGNVIADTEILSGKITTDYTAAEKTVTNYTLTKQPTNATGKFTGTPQTVTYVYDLVDAAKVTVNYVDTDGNVIADSETLNGKITTPYSATEKSITNYALTTQPDNATGIFKDTEQTVTYVYDLIAGANVTVKYVDTDGNEIADTETLSGKITTAYTSTEKSITNYTLTAQPGNALGTFTDTEQTVTYVYDLIAGANVTVKYVDIDGNEIADTETLSGKITTAYTASEKSITNYALTAQPGNATGTFTDTEQTVTYVYDLIAGEPVTVLYVDTEDNEIADTETLNGKITTPYASVEKTIGNYKLVEVPANATGTFKDTKQTVTYVYDLVDAAKVTVKYVDIDGNEIADTETLSGKITTTYASVEKAIENYSLTSKPSNASGTFTDTEQTVTYVYDLIAGANVTVKYVDIDGNEIADTETLSGKITTAYTASEKTITNYALTAQPDNATGVFTNKGQTVTYVYDLIDGAKVTVNYVDTEGNEIADTETLNGKITKPYTSVEKTITNYALTAKPVNATGTFTDTEQTVTYVYDLVDGATVTVKYVDIDGNEIADTETLNGKATTPYTSLQKDIKNYALTQQPTNASGTFTTEPQTVTYVYDLVDGAKVTVNYVDTEGNEIADTETLNGKITKPYASVEKTITNYALTTKPNNATGTFTDTEQTVTYVYNLVDGAAVTVKYVDIDGNEIADTETLNGKATTPYTSVQKDIKNYALTQQPSNTTGTFTTEAQTVTYVYDLVDGANVIVNYVDTDGNTVSPSEVLTGKITTPYLATAKNVENYKLTEVPKNASGTFTDSEQVVTYVYEKEEVVEVTPEKPEDPTPTTPEPTLPNTGIGINYMNYFYVLIGFVLIVLGRKKYKEN